jgi:hypothetical protein
MVNRLVLNYAVGFDIGALNTQTLIKNMCTIGFRGLILVCE